MADIKQLLAEKERIEKEQAKLEQQIQKLQQKAKTELRDKIIKMCTDAGTTVEELFGVGKKKSSAGGGRPKGPQKYMHNGVDYDGRVARGMDAFDKVQDDGKIDDRKALKAGMINPKWLTSEKAAAKQFVRDHDVDVEKYAS